MLKLSVPDMSCNHCKKTIEETIDALDDAADIEFDMDARTIETDAVAKEEDIVAALATAGFPASKLQ